MTPRDLAPARVVDALTNQDTGRVNLAALPALPQVTDRRARRRAARQASRLRADETPKTRGKAKSSCPSKKRAYATELDAAIALANIVQESRMGKPRGKEPHRHYACPLCGLHHLTSAPLRGAAVAA